MLIAAAALVLTVLGHAQQPEQPQQPQQPQTPGSSSRQSTTVVVPPPPGQAPVVVQPRDRPVQVAPCPVGAIPKPNSIATVAGWTLLGGAVGTGIGAAVGGINGNTTSQAWGRDLGTGALFGVGVGVAAGATVATIDWIHWSDSQKRVSVAPVINSRQVGVAMSGSFQ
jgi:hypothetical protein